MRGRSFWSPGGDASHARRGFTLIELLVVIAIISLLLAILLPSLEEARKAAKKAVCTSNLKGISTSAHVYGADDPQGWGIPVHPLQFFQNTQDPTFIGAYEWGGKSGIGNQEYLDSQTGIHASKYGTAAGFGPATRALNQIYYKEGFTDYTKPSYSRTGGEADTKLALDAFKCPADDGPPRVAHCRDWIDKFKDTSSYDYFGNSYSANVFMVAVSTGGIMATNSPYMRPLTRVPVPSRTIFFEENIGRWAWAAREDVCDFLDGVNIDPFKTLEGWHGPDWMYLRSFVDSHVEFQKVLIEGTKNNRGYYNHYRREFLDFYPPWDVACDGYDPSDYPPNDPYLETAFRCIIIRGEGWQKDTLPNELLCTGIWHDGSGRPSYEGCVRE